MAVQNKYLTIHGHILRSFCCLPAIIQKNVELAKEFELPDKPAVLLSESIQKHTGIAQRRYAEKNAASSDLIVKAVQATTITLADINAIIVATTSGDYPSPATAHCVHAGLKLQDAVHCFDVASSCSSFLSAFRSALGVMLTSHKHVLIAASEVKNKGLPKTDLRTRSLFGDGAAGLLLKQKANNENYDFFCFCHEESNSKIIHNIMIPVGGSKEPTTIDNIHKNKLFLNQPKETFVVIVKALVKAIEKSWAERINLLKSMNENDTDSIPCTIFIHQANKNILKEVKQKINANIANKIPILMTDIGNTVCASLPILRARFLFLKSIISYEKNFVTKDELVNYFKTLCQKTNKFSYTNKNNGIVFTAFFANEIIEIFDDGCSSIDNCWLQQIDTEEYLEILFLLKDSLITCNEKMTRIKYLDIWITAGGGFQTVTLLHGKINTFTS